MSKKLPSKLYHYCSLNTFVNIIKSRSIWLSDISKSNDKQELTWLKNRFELFLYKQWVDYAKSKEKIDDLQSVDFSEFEKTHLFTNYLMKNNLKTSYVFCLSECRDDLGQWRGYADDGRGISIGFNANVFHVLCQIYSNANNDFNFNFCKIKYGEKSADELFTSFSKALEINTGKSSEDVLSQLESTSILTMELAPTIKNIGFKQEKEWRLIYNVDNSDILDGNLPTLPQCLTNFSDIVHINGLSYCVKNDGIVGHTEMTFTTISDMINEVIIGPKCSATKDDILMFLISEGIIKNEKDCKIKVGKSQSSYV